MAHGQRDEGTPTAVPTATDPLDDDPRLQEYFGAAWPVLAGFAGLLRRYGAERGLIGPNESSRLWERHLLNSAGAAACLPDRGIVVDLGSGAGLPGIVLAAMRPQVQVVLVEPMERRTDWLHLVAGELQLTNVEVRRGRAEELVGTLRADVVTARALSALSNLFRWAAPLVRSGGQLCAIKGSRAAHEVAEAASSAAQYGWADVHVKEVETLTGVEVTRIVHAVRKGKAASVR